MAREYGEDLGNGMVRVVRENDDGTYTVLRIESMQENQGQSPAPTGGQDLGAMRSGLQQAGYNGPWDDASVIAAYNRTVNGGNAGSGSPNNFGGLWDSLTKSNQQTFDEQQRQFNQSLLSSLLSGLLGTSTQLASSPANWLDYANNTAGGRNIFDLLKGSTPASPFQSPGGFTANNSLRDLLVKIGLIPSQESAQSGNSAMSKATEPITNNSNFMAPLPHQANPLVWDSLNPVAQAVILSSAKAGNTPSGYWSPEDYIAQINAARPQGRAPSQVMFDYQGPQGVFNQSSYW